jgi:hypothetical protein
MLHIWHYFGFSTIIAYTYNVGKKEFSRITYLITDWEEKVKMCIKRLPVNPTQRQSSKWKDYKYAKDNEK